MKIAISAIILLALTACSTAGPFVTNITRDGCELVIEKAYVEHDGLAGTIKNKDAFINKVNICN